MIGKTLGHYEIAAPLGRGGMGEVYLADDLNLNRKVALKFLPDVFAGDPERMARFEREAKLLASLNHPNIAAIYGLEQAEGKRFLVLELVEGETLAQRLSKGPLSVEESLGICRQIAEALEAAHEKGVIHRDLKLANVMITEGDKVKILDFGLAKALSDETQSVDSSQSPTLTEAMTRPGVILGTAAYMSPEQAKGKTVDKRTDIWAFGCILYECLTGKKAFEGETVTETLAAILRGDPDWNTLPATTPQGIRFVLRRCLEKDLSRRLRDAADVRIEMEEGHGSSFLKEELLLKGTGWRRVIPLVLTALIALTAGIICGWMFKSSPTPSHARVGRFTVSLPSSERLALGSGTIALSPDDRQLVYAGIRGDVQQLYLRPIDSIESKAIPGTEGAVSPFFSPDGQWIGFFAAGKLKKVSANGGSVQTLCNASLGVGGTWGPDDIIYFAPFNISGLWKIPASGGTPQQVTRLDRSKGEISHRWPHILPGGKALVFTIWTGPGWDEQAIAVLSLHSGEKKILVEGGSSARYVPTGHLVYCHAERLMAIPFDPTATQVTGGPAVPLNEKVVYSGEGTDLAVSHAGSLAYISPSEERDSCQLVWVDRNGRVETLAAPPHDYQSIRLSPDGRRILATIMGPNQGVWIYDLARSALTRLTSDEGSSQWAIWAPDGKRVIYRGTRTGFRNLYWKAADGSDAEERLTEGESSNTPYSISPDGKYIVYGVVGDKTGPDIWLLGMEGERKPRVLLASTLDEGEAGFSPDGRVLAYVSNASGRDEVYVQPFPGPGGKLQVSTEGGTDPVWNRNGRELFYLNGDKMMSVSMLLQPALTAASPRLLFEARHVSNSGTLQEYDVSPDGSRFLMIRGSAQERTASQIQIVLNWFEELKQRVPVK